MELFKKKLKKEVAKVSWKDIMDALRRADAYIFSNYRDKVSMIKQNAEWRTWGPTEKQVALLKKFGYHNADQLTKGQASNLLSKIFADREKKKAGK